MLVLGPIIFGFILGLLIGSRLKDNPNSDVKFPISSFVVILIVAVICAWLLDQYPYYNDVSLATGFITGAIGLIIGKLLFGRFK